MADEDDSSAGRASREQIYCECGNLLWTEVVDGDDIYLMLGTVKNLHFSGSCGSCGRRLEWHVHEQKLERLIRRRLNQRECKE